MTSAPVTSAPMSLAPGGAYLRLASDGTLRVSGAGADGADHRIERLSRMRALLGSGEEHGVAPTPALAFGGHGRYDQSVPASLAHLPLTGDLAPYGWRIGPGASHDWREASREADRLMDAARIAFFGYEGPLQLTRLGPVALASATFTAAGERVLSDPGLLADLPFVLAEALGRAAGSVRAMVPGAAPRLLIDERSATAAVLGRVPTASGYRTYAPLGPRRFGELLAPLLTETHTHIEAPACVALTPLHDIVTAALDAGSRSLALDPTAGDLANLGRTWETLAAARESGVELTFLVPAHRLREAGMHALTAWRRLGYGPREAAGFGFATSRSPRSDLSRALPPEAFTTSADLDALRRYAVEVVDTLAG